MLFDHFDKKSSHHFFPSQDIKVPGSVKNVKQKSIVNAQGLN